MFVSGGPLLIGYLSNEIKEKTSFRATISTIWIILNSMILVQDICAGMWNAGLVMTQCISIPFLIAGMAAIRITCGLVIFVSDMAPVTSE